MDRAPTLGGMVVQHHILFHHSNNSFPRSLWLATSLNQALLTRTITFNVVDLALHGNGPKSHKATSWLQVYWKRISDWGLSLPQTSFLLPKISLTPPSHKLAPRFYGPFQISANISPVAYRLQLPSSSYLHLLFHVFLLKPKIGAHTLIPVTLPPFETNGSIAWVSQCVLDMRLFKSAIELSLNVQ